MPMAGQSTMLEIPATLKPRRSAQPVQTQVPAIPEMAGSLRPVLDAQVQTRSRRSDTQELKPIHYAPFLADPKPFQTTHSELVQKPRLLQNRLTATWDAPQFLGHGAAYAMPTDFTLHSRRADKVFEDVGMQSRTFPAQQSQWERMMGWMPRHISFAEGFQADTSSRGLANTLLTKFFRLYDQATKYYLDAVFPIPSFNLENSTGSGTVNSPIQYKNPATEITYKVSSSNGSDTLHNLFDENSDTTWDVSSINVSSTNPYIIITASKPTTLSAIKLSRSGKSTHQSFNSFTIYGKVNDEFYTYYTSTTSDGTKITSSSEKVAVTISFAPGTAYTEFKVEFTGATGSGTRNIAMHTLQLYGGDITESFYNLISPYKPLYTIKSGNTYEIESFVPHTPETLQMYQYYKWSITKVRTAVTQRVQANRFRFLLQDGSEYQWKTNGIDANMLDATDISTGYRTSKTSAGESTNLKGDFATNPGGSNTRGINDSNGNPTARNDGFYEPSYMLIINNYTLDNQTYEIPPDEKQTSTGGVTTINRALKKWLDWRQPLDTAPKDIIFILQEPGLFTGYRFMTGNDSSDSDPVSWTLYGTNIYPYSPGTDFTNGKNTTINVIDVEWNELSDISDEVNVPLSRGTFTSSFSLSQSITGIRYIFTNAYKELCRIIVDKYKSVARDMLLTSDETKLNSISNCQITATSVSTDTLKTVYNSEDLTNIINFETTITTGTTISVNTETPMDTIINRYIEFVSSDITGAWPTLYNRIKCIAIDPIDEYIAYLPNKPEGVAIPTGFPQTVADATAERNGIISETNILSVVAIINVYNRYRRIRAYFRIKTFQQLYADAITNTTNFGIVNIGTTVTAAPVTQITTLATADSRASFYLAEAGLPNIPTDSTGLNNLAAAYDNAILGLGKQVFTAYKTHHDEFKNIGMSVSEFTTAYQTANTLAEATAIDTNFETECSEFVKTDGALSALRTKMIAFLQGYATHFNAIRGWAVGILGTSITLFEETTKGMAITTVPAAITYTAETDPKFPTLDTLRTTYTDNMSRLVGNSETTTNSIRKSLFDKIRAVVQLFNRNIDFVKNNTVYNWIPVTTDATKVTQGTCGLGQFAYQDGCCPTEPGGFQNGAFTTCSNPSCTTQCVAVTADIVKVQSTTNIVVLIRLWNRYNIESELNAAIGTAQTAYQTTINNYNDLYNAYVGFHSKNGSFVSPSLPPLPSTNPTITGPEEQAVTPSNYAAMVTKYGSFTTGMFKDLIDFVKAQLASYIPAFYGKYDAIDELLEGKEIDKSFYSQAIKTADADKVAATATPTSLDLVVLLKSYNVYTEQYRVRDERYNTLVIIDYYSQLISNNTSTEIFPTSGVLSADTILTDIRTVVSEAEAPSPSISLDTSSVNVTLRNTLQGIHQKYKTEFETLYGAIKTNLETTITAYENLHDAYVVFQSGFTAFSSLDVFTGLKTPTDLPNLPDFSQTNQTDCIEKLNQRRDAYLATTGSVKGVHTQLRTHVNTQLDTFRTTLGARFESSLVTEKPVLPAGYVCP